MPYWRRKRRGITFVFKSDPLDDRMAHIYARHLRTEDDAVDAWFDGLMTAWNQPRRRFETYAAEDVLYWYWLDEAARVVMVVSCFPRRKRS